ncbi:MAG: hypothetical protein IPK87_00145 [Planctomycetes bacterium]|nr:hypothetical protein [Planctomycetota bacterium]
MTDALQILRAFRESTEAQPWPKPGAHLDIVAYGAWLDLTADFWKESGEGILNEFAAHRRRIETLTVTALEDLRAAVKSHGAACLRALARQVKQSKAESAKLNGEASEAEEGHRVWMDTEAQRKTRWAEDLQQARTWVQHHTTEWLRAIDYALVAPFDAPLIAFGLPPGGEEIPECEWQGVFQVGQQDYPNNSPPNKFNVFPSGDPNRPNARLTGYGLGAQTLGRCDLPRLAAPKSYLAGLREQGKSPWIIARVVEELLRGASPSTVNEFVAVRPPGSTQITEWWWYSVMPTIYSWNARHQPTDGRQPVLHIWEKRVEVSEGGKQSHVHPDDVAGKGLSINEWHTCRADGRTLTSREAESIALSVAALLDSLCHHAASFRVKIEAAAGKPGAMVTWLGTSDYVRPALATLLLRAGNERRLANSRINDRRELNNCFPGIEDYLPTEPDSTGKGENKFEQATFVSRLVGMVDDLRPLAVGMK